MGAWGVGPHVFSRISRFRTWSGAVGAGRGVFTVTHVNKELFVDKEETQSAGAAACVYVVNVRMPGRAKKDA